MAHEINWLSSQAGMCKVNLYSPSGPKEQERKVICFVDVSNLNPKDRHSMNIDHDPTDDVDLGNLAEKEIIIIKDDEQCNHMNTEGAVCLFKQGSSDDLNVVSWLSKDLQKYAVGFHHALTPSSENQNKTNSFDSPRPDKASQNNNNTAPSISLNDRENPDDLAYYANKLCSLVVEMTRKEIKDKWESSGKCIRQTISPHGTVTKTISTEGMEASKTSQERSVRIDDPFQSETPVQNNFKETERYADTAKKHEEYTSVSKGMMLCANQAASDMMLSFLKTMKVQKGKQAQPACAVLKEVLLRHTKEIVSDFIDSSMKNLHNITGALMTDSDFVCAVKKNVYNVGIQKTVEILEAIVKRLFRLLEDKSYRSQNLGFAAFKTATQGNQRTQGMQFASLKTETPVLGKDRGGGPSKPYPSGSRVSENQASLDVYAKEILVTALSQIQQHLLEKCRDRLARREANASSFGTIHQDQNNDRSPGSYNSKPHEGRLDYNQSEALKEKAGLILSMVQKVLNEAGLTCEQNRR